ncbi:glycosyltransferase family 2 protein [soil metagenome]
MTDPMTTGPAKVSIIIPTQRRPGPLALALGSVLAQTGVDADTLEIVIVDNDQTPSARAAIQATAAASATVIRYVHEPRAGVAHARNTAVAASTGAFIAFLDDDEEAPPTWLSDLLAVQARFDADVVFGPVNARLPAAITRHRAYLTRFFSRPGPAGAQVLDTYYGCGNSLLRRASLPNRSEPFDLSRNHIGGEDDLLFGTMQAAGARFAWAPAAWVHEDPAPNRLTLAYTLRRAFAYGQGPTSHCAAHSDRLGMARWMAIGLGQAAVFGLWGVVRWIARAPDVAETWDRAARGLGKTFWGGPMKIQFYGTSA